MMQFTRRQYLALCGASLSAAPLDSLSERWRQIAGEARGTLGAAALHLATGQHAELNPEQHFPLASVCKLPCAMHILALVDEGKLARDAEIEVLPQDVTLNVSPVGHRWPKQRRFPLDELLLLMIAHSDNTAVETFYRIGGGPSAITARLEAWRLDGVRIDRTERQCNRDAARSMARFIADPRDTATPAATVRIFERLYQGELLSAPSTARMIALLEATETGAGRIKGLLPAGVVVAHKTGTSGVSGGLSAATNDVGVITLPRSRGRLAVAFYLKGSTRDLPARERIIARAAQAAFEAFITVFDSLPGPCRMPPAAHEY